MIRIKEKYDLTKIRNYMSKLGFEEFQSPMSMEREYSGLITFAKNGWVASFNYPPETLSFESPKRGTGSWCCFNIRDIKSIECTPKYIDIVATNGAEAQLWV